MAKLSLTDLTSLSNQTSAVTTINNNNTLVETALENTLSRDGTSPNTMGTDLDMNGNQILNLPAATEDTEPVRKAEFDDAVDAINANGLVLSSSGMVAYDSITGVASARTITGSGGVTITNGDGVSGAPAISFDSSTISYPSGLNPIKSLTPAADKVAYYTGASTAALTDLTSTARSLIDDTSINAMRTTLGLAIGTDVLAYDAGLAATSTFAKTYLDDTTAKQFRATTGTTPILNIKITTDSSNSTTGDNKIVFAIDSSLNGLDLLSANAYVSSASSSGLPNVQIRNITNGNNDMLSTAITIDANEFTSYTAATPHVVNPSFKTVSTGDLIAVDIDGVGTSSGGYGVILVFG